MNSSILVLIIVVVLLVAIPIGMYNGLVSRRIAVDNSFASLDANLQKRFDLVPNLVAAVKGYMGHERETLERISQLRAGATTPQTRLEADAQLTPALRQILIVAENYPQLRANENFNQLQRTLVELEEQISASRRAFSAAVTDYNTTMQTFPTLLLANAFGFKPREMYRAEDAARTAPRLTGQF